MREALHTEIALKARSCGTPPAPGLIHHSDRGIQYAAEPERPARAISHSTLDEPLRRLSGQRVNGELSSQPAG